jgi:hypothetical protein
MLGIPLKHSYTNIEFFFFLGFKTCQAAVNPPRGAAFPDMTMVHGSSSRCRAAAELLLLPLLYLWVNYHYRRMEWKCKFTQTRRRSATKETAAGSKKAVMSGRKMEKEEQAQEEVKTS